MSAFLLLVHLSMGLSQSGVELSLSSNVAMIMFIVSQGKKEAEPLKKNLGLYKGEMILNIPDGSRVCLMARPI